jgi:hypothetical protein
MAFESEQKKGRHIRGGMSNDRILDDQLLGKENKFVKKYGTYKIWMNKKT